ncbi:MAG TPA: DegV family protein [Ktedonobacterales bacterium]|jgi:DegV family protein with EDD domain|nr:DegV family protein [Ktedonobacterales bacterium]
MSSALDERAYETAQPVRRVAVVTESACCLPPALARQYGVDILPIPYSFGDATYRDGVDLTPAQFYDLLRRSKTLPHTSPPSPGDYLEAWKRAAARGEDVVTVCVDGSISTMQRSTRLAQRLAPAELPETTIRVVDSRSAGMGQGFVALAAARAAVAGASLDEVAAEAERVSQRVRLLVTLDTLDYLAQASRIPQVAAIVGGMLSIKPLFMLSGGDVQVLERVRARKRSIRRLLDHLRAMVPPGARLHAAVQHADAAAEAHDLEDTIREQFTCAELYTTEFTPVMGGYCGPGLLGVAFYYDDVPVEVTHERA